MKTPNFPLGDKELKIGMLGFSEGNAHPFSWSAMFNGYDKDEMNKWCAKDYPAIPNYLGKQPAHTLGIPGAKITHICFTGDEDRTMAEGCAKATFIPNVCDRPEEMIGQVDAVICATDKGFEHVERVRPFIEAGIPLFIDKPMTDNEEDLRTLVKWHDEGAKFISSSSMRYTKELEPYIQNRYEIGPLRYILSPMAKYWENYGIHALERIFPLIGQGVEWVENMGTKERGMVHMYHKDGIHVDMPMGRMASPGAVVCGEYSSKIISSSDSYYPFKKQLDEFVKWLRTGEIDYPFEDTIEMAKIIIAGIRSREEGGRRVYLSEISER
ncbi:MAG: oxidoreductase [Ruminococcaceae bacterium]|nr:oxidoreductase [Oscillospiraceae bacterium]